MNDGFAGVLSLFSTDVDFLIGEKIYIDTTKHMLASLRVIYERMEFDCGEIHFINISIGRFPHDKVAQQSNYNCFKITFAHVRFVPRFFWIAKGSL